MENKRIWLVLLLIFLGYLFFKEDEPKPSSVATFNYQMSRPYTFNGRNCLGDCSGHQAGYQWAEDNDIDDESDCTGNSQSFIEGCIAYVEENN